MFYLSNRKGAFFAGYVPAGGDTAIMLEGHMSGGRSKIHKKFEERRETPQMAWDFLCEQVSAARADGYLDATIINSTLKIPTDVHAEAFPLGRRGVYVHLALLTPEHFAAGLDRLNEVHSVVGDAGVQVKVTDGDRWIRLSHGSNVIQFGFVTDALWATMSAKAKELSTERKMLNGNYLLPDGVGLWHLQTSETALDLYVRAFMAGAMEAGAEVRFTSDHEWSFSATSPFHSLHVKALDWYQKEPGLLQKVLALTKPSDVPLPSGGWDFYL